MNQKVIPHTSNALTLSATNSVSGKSENLVLSQRGANELATANGSFVDAPQDGKSYARKNGAWVEVVAVEEAPQDGKSYVRKNGAWVEETTAP